MLKIDGKKAAADLRADLKKKVAELKSTYNAVPGLTVILVGEDAPSQIYVRNKEKSAIEVGINSEVIRYPENIEEKVLLNKIKELNKNNKVSGILVQLPLPKHIDKRKVIETMDPGKDVDGFHPMNVGNLSSGHDSSIPCTPLGCSLLIKQVEKNLSGKHAVVIGRSNLNGKPMTQLLLKENCTVTITHSKTKDITGGLPRVAELFEARKPKESAIIAENDGSVNFGKEVRGKLKISIQSKDGEVSNYLIPKGKHINFNEGEKIKKGEYLLDGSPAPHDILRILGIAALTEYYVNEVQEVYRLQGVVINDKHIETILRQMLKKVEIKEPGDSNYLLGEVIEKNELDNINKILKKENPSDRLSGSLAAEVVCVLNGANIIRTHNVAETKEAITIAQKIS